jgi:hypothetical protein
MNPTSRMSLTASQAGENSHTSTNDPEHTIISRILTDLKIKRKQKKQQKKNSITGTH